MTRAASYVCNEHRTNQTLRPPKTCHPNRTLSEVEGEVEGSAVVFPLPKWAVYLERPLARCLRQTASEALRLFSGLPARNFEDRTLV